MKLAALALVPLLLLLLPATPAHPGWTEEWCQPAYCVRIDTDPHFFIMHSGWNNGFRGVWMDTNGVHGLQALSDIAGTPADQRLVRL